MAKLGDICTVVSGTTPKTGISEYWDGEVKWITPAELNEESFYIYDSVRHITELGKEKTGLTYMPVGTVLLSSRAPIGKTAIAGCEMCCNQGFKNLICSKSVFNEYLYYFLKGNTEYLDSLGRGATFKEISKGIVENIEIPLPDLKEQKAIASKMGKIYHLIDLRKKQISKLDELVKSRFIEIFGDPMNSKDFPRVSISTVGDVLTGTTPSMKKSEYYDSDDILFIKPGDIADEGVTVITSAEKFISERARSAGRIFPEKSVLVTCIGTIGKVGIAAKESSCNQQINVIVPNIGVNHIYLAYCVLYMRDMFKEAANAPVVPILNKRDFSKMEILFPPLKLQKKFSDFVRQTDESKLVIRQSLDKLELLKKSLMQQYFRFWL